MVENHYSGNIFSGEFDGSDFYLTEVKNIGTTSTLTINQLNRLTKYLREQSDTCTITVNDQLPVLLQQEEISELMRDLDEIMDKLK